MEVITNNAMIVTALPSFKDEVEKVYGFAKELFGDSVTPLITNPIGYQTFFISTTGTLNGSTWYKEFENKRSELAEFIDCFGFEDDSNIFQVIDVSYNEVNEVHFNDTI